MRMRKDVHDGEYTMFAFNDEYYEDVICRYDPPDDNRKAQYISMTLVDSALVNHFTDTGNMVTDDDSDSLLLTMYGDDDE